MSIHRFTLILEGPDIVEDDDLLDRFDAAGLDDVLFGMRDGVQYAAFDREAASFKDAVRSAIEQLITAAPEVAVKAVELDDDALLTMAKIAERAGVSRQYVQMFIKGERGPGDFPLPANRVGDRTRLWRWSDVAPWLSRVLNKSYSIDEHVVGFVHALNGALELRAYEAEISEPEEREFVERLLPESLVHA